jgi:hypothetical protein
VLLLLPLFGHAQQGQSDNCKASKPRKTDYGEFIKVDCGTAKTGYKETISFNGVSILSDVRLFDEDHNKDYSLRVYTSGAANPKTGCPSNLYLVDVSTQPVRVFSFGVKSACNEFHWASWGANRSVIALKDNVQFVYENGKITPPKADSDLWRKIKPTMFSTPVEKLIPFADEVPMPPGK